MPVVNREVLIATSKGFSKVFNNALTSATPQYEKIATVVTSNNLTEDYKWLGDLPKMREWVGDRELKDLEAYDYTIKKKDFEMTIEVSRDDIEFDRLGLVKPRIETMGHESATHYDELVFPLLESNGLCYDGKNFFSADHKLGEKTYRNIGNLVLNQKNLMATRAKMRTIKSDTGKALRIKPDLLVVPPELEETAIKLLKADLIDGSTNITKGIMDYIVADDFTSATGWYVLDTTRPLKPLILQKTKEIKFTAMDGDNDENVFMRKSYRYGVDSMDNAGYGLWQLAFFNDGSQAAQA